jgi:hypothetical protein
VYGLETVALQRAEVVDVAGLGAHVLEDLEVPRADVVAELRLEILTQVGRHPIVVEQRVVYVEHDHDIGRSGRAGVAHDATAGAAGSCHGPFAPTSCCASSGPQLPCA